MNKGIIRNIYMLLGIGLSLTFVGHGILALKGYDKFTELVVGNYDKVLGGTMSVDTATSWVNAVGVIDVALAVVFLGLVVAMYRGLEQIAFSKAALVLFGWAVVWGFLTALSRFTAVMDGAEIWDVVERGANFMLPAALAYIVYVARKEHAPAKKEARAERRAGAAGPSVPTPAH